MIDENKLLKELNEWEKIDNEICDILKISISTFKKMIESQPKDHDLEWYKHEYYSECDRAENLEKALDKACDELGFLGNNLLGKEQWKEWCLKDE